jgi:hypothetical protein
MMAAWREAPSAGRDGRGGSSEGWIGMAAAAGMEAVGRGNGDEEVLGVSVSAMSRNLNRGG